LVCMSAETASADDFVNENKVPAEKISE
jgi:hypothetical protein